MAVESTGRSVKELEELPILSDIEIAYLNAFDLLQSSEDVISFNEIEGYMNIFDYILDPKTDARILKQISMSFIRKNR